MILVIIMSVTCHLTRGDKQRLLASLESLEITTGHIRCYSIGSKKVKKIGNVPIDIDEEFVFAKYKKYARIALSLKWISDVTSD